MPSMSIRAYSASRAADRKSIRRKIADGTIVLDKNGRIDPEQADAAWASTRRASRMGQYQNGEAGAHSAVAKVAVAAAKLQLATAKFETANARYHDRAEAIRVARAEARYALDALRASPDSAAAEAFAAALGIDSATARTILRQFVDRALAEVGDLEQQAVHDAEVA